MKTPTSLEIEQFAKDFIAYCQLPKTREVRKALQTNDHPLSYVTDEQSHYIDYWPHLVLPFIDEVLKRTKDEKIIAYLAAGTLEDLLNKFPEAYIDEIEKRARQNSLFRQCLSGVWPSGISAPIFKRISILTRCGVPEL